MKTEVRKMWTAALRSGKYKQGSSRLRIDDEYCCLAVLCELAVEQGIIAPAKIFNTEYGLYAYEGELNFLPGKVVTWAGLKGHNPHAGKYTLSSWNDGKGADFIKIADLIDEHLSEGEDEQLEIPVNA